MAGMLDSGRTRRNHSLGVMTNFVHGNSTERLGRSKYCWRSRIVVILYIWKNQTIAMNHMPAMRS